MSEDMRKNLRDMLDELDRYFEEFENDVQDAVRQRLSSMSLRFFRMSSLIQLTNS